MTEAEWLTCTNPTLMLELLRGQASERKLRLFAVACCRRVSHLLKDERSQEAVEVGEQYADGLVTEDALDEARENSSDACGVAHGALTTAASPADAWVANAAANAAYGVCGHWQNWLFDTRLFETPVWAAQAMSGLEVEHDWSDVAQSEGIQNEQEMQCELVRDLFGPIPFRNVGFDRASLQMNDARLSKLAQVIYHERAFDRLPVLADALEDAGCDNADILVHCRGPGPHVRGCWVVDLLLGKE
jgi:hypothetical protein